VNSQLFSIHDLNRNSYFCLCTNLFGVGTACLLPFSLICRHFFTQIHLSHTLSHTGNPFLALSLLLLLSFMFITLPITCFYLCFPSLPDWNERMSLKYKYFFYISIYSYLIICFIYLIMIKLKNIRKFF
jgi:hypothetical protein